MVDSAFSFLVPSIWEVEVSLATAVFLIVALWFFTWSSGEKCFDDNSDDTLKKMDQLKGDFQADFGHVIKVKLLAAKNLIGAKLNGTSDPYAIISCGTEKRYSSVVPSSRNPMWGEEFQFSVDELPVQLTVTIYNWDIIWKSTVIGSAAVPVENQNRAGPVWYTLDSPAGQVCLDIQSRKLASRPIVSNGSSDPNPLKSGPIVAHPKSGPLRTIFDLILDEVVEHSFSCALERSFLYHGRMFVSAQHICFHSNVFSKQMKVIIPLADIEEIRRTQHAFVNPAISIILRLGAGGHGVPPLGSQDGRVRYKFASFWNRNHVLRALQLATKNFQDMLEVKKKEKEESALCAHNSSTESCSKQAKAPEDSACTSEKHQAFIKEEVLVGIHDDVLPCTAELFFDLLLKDNSTFANEYRSARKDKDINMGQWHKVDEHDGQVRKIKLRSLCNNPMCPPDTAMTEWQHVVFSPDKKKLVFETVQQLHDVPFGSCFEIHCRWSLETVSQSSCALDVKVGAHIKKWCIAQSRIKSGVVIEHKKDVALMLEVARSYMKPLKTSEDGSKLLDGLHFMQMPTSESALCAPSSSTGSGSNQAKAPEDSACKIVKQQAFIKEEVLVGIHNDVIPLTADLFFDLLLKDNSAFTNEYRSVRKDKDITLGQWHKVDEYDGEVREIKLRSLCSNPMCPPDTAMTEWQHAVFSPDKKKLVFETVQQLHDVPFGSCFEIHCRWSLETVSEKSCALDVKVGAHIKKWCIAQSRIKSGVIIEHKKDVALMLEVARSYMKPLKTSEDESKLLDGLHFMQVPTSESALCAPSSSTKSGIKQQAKAPEDSACKSKKHQAFIKEEVLVGIHNDVIPLTADLFFDLLLKDNSTFTNEYRSIRKDKDIIMGQWHKVDEHDGQVREIKLRSLCSNPMCPPDTAMTELQRVVFSPDKKKLVFETVQQLHDVPFGSCFEIHCRWSLETVSESSCALDVKVGAHIKKWCIAQSRIKSGVIIEQKKDVALMLEVAHSYMKPLKSSEDESKLLDGLHFMQVPTPESALCAPSSSTESGSEQAKAPEDSACKSENYQAFINEEVLVDIHNDIIPLTADLFFDLLLKDNSTFTNEYRSVRKDKDITIGQWHKVDEHDGQVREIKLRSLCSNPMCPPDTAMTEWQHVVFSPDKKKLVFETVQQLHDVPFGWCFEIHCRWSLETVSESSCSVDVKVGAHIKKWCLAQSRIKAGVIIEHKKDVALMLEVARSYMKRLKTSEDESKLSMDSQNSRAHVVGK